MTKTFYVEPNMRYVAKRGHEYLTPACFVHTDRDGRPQPLPDSLGLYEVQCQAQDQAVAIVLRWLLLGRPQAVTVRALWESEQVRKVRKVLSP